MKQKNYGLNLVSEKKPKIFIRLEKEEIEGVHVKGDCTRFV